MSVDVMLVTIAGLGVYFDDEAELENALSITDYKLILDNDVNLEGERLKLFNEKFLSRRGLIGIVHR
ncbi:MAG: hypothetical protein IJT08_01670 [Alphaproteobacteria bacterium]|nr:hypothetical protein [Alphaproteobacteria bacterium]